MICAPLEVVKTRMQVAGSIEAEAAAADASGETLARVRAYRSMGGSFKSIWTNEGHFGFYRGISATLATVPLFWAVYFPLYHRLKGE